MAWKHWMAVCFVIFLMIGENPSRGIGCRRHGRRGHCVNHIFRRHRGCTTEHGYPGRCGMYGGLCRCKPLRQYQIHFQGPLPDIQTTTRVI